MATIWPDRNKSLVLGFHAAYVIQTEVPSYNSRERRERREHAMVAEIAKSTRRRVKHSVGRTTPITACPSPAVKVLRHLSKHVWIHK